MQVLNFVVVSAVEHFGQFFENRGERITGAISDTDRTDVVSDDQIFLIMDLIAELVCVMIALKYLIFDFLDPGLINRNHFIQVAYEFDFVWNDAFHISFPPNDYIIA